MAKWADYGISAVQYNREHTHIVKVRLQPDNGDSMGAVTEWSRSQVVTSLEAGRSFVTILQNGGQWKRGEDVRTVTINGSKYIRTDSNSRAADNLGSLPEF
jgi:hypothetical protein